MQGKLVVRDEIVQSCINAGRASQRQLEGASAFADGLAAAAGTNGPLAGTLREAEGAWRIRRDKLLGTLKKLVDSIEAIDKAFKETDDGFKKLMPGCDPEGQPDQGGKGKENPGGGSQGGSTGGGGSAGGSGQPGGGAGGAGPAPLPSPEPTRPSGGVPPLGDAPKQPENPSQPHQPILNGMPPDREGLIRDFANRWSVLTGKPVEEITRVLTISLGVTGLLALGGTGVAVGLQQAGAGAAGTPGARHDGLQASGGPGGSTSQQEKLADGPSAQDGDLTPPDGSQPASAPNTSADPETPETSLSDLDKEPADQQPGSSQNLPANEVSSEPELDVSSQDKAALSPVVPPEDGKPAKLASLGSLDSGGGGAGSGSGGGGGGLNLPPLEPVSQGSDGSSGSSTSVRSLPDLAPVGSAGTSGSADVPKPSLPDLSVEPSEPKDQSSGRAMAAPLMGGMMAAGAMGGAAATPSNPTGTTAGNDREFVRQTAKDVLGLHEGEEKR